MALRIIGIDHGSKESLVKECGAEVFLDITKFDDKTLPEEVKKATGGLGASAVIVCTASNAAYAQALSFLRFGGTLVCVGMPEGDSKPIANSFPSAIVRKSPFLHHVIVPKTKDTRLTSLIYLGIRRMGHQGLSCGKSKRGIGGPRNGRSRHFEDSSSS